MIYLVFLVYLFIKKSYTIQQHLLFFCSFALSVGLINLMLFPIIIDDFNSIPYIQARQYKHNLLPFKYWIRDLFENRTINDVNNNYYHGEMTLEEIHAHLQIYRAELIQLILFAFLNLAIITALVSCRLWLTHKTLTVRRAIMLPILLFIFLDLIYFILWIPACFVFAGVVAFWLECRIIIGLRGCSTDNQGQHPIF